MQAQHQKLASLRGFATLGVRKLITLFRRAQAPRAHNIHNPGSARQHGSGNPGEGGIDGRKRDVV
jgi:hypothetical protein